MGGEICPFFDFYKKICYNYYIIKKKGLIYLSVFSLDKDTFDFKNLIDLVGYSFIFNSSIFIENKYDPTYIKVIQIKSMKDCVDYYGYKINDFSMMNNIIRLAATPSYPEHKYKEMIEKEKERMGF